MPNETISFLQRMQEYGIWGYVWIAFISFWAGTIKYLTSLKDGDKPTALGWFIDTITSGFVGVITAMVCQYYQVDFLLTSAITGIAAHNGTRSLGLITYFLKKNTQIATIDTQTSFPEQKLYSKRPDKDDSNG